MQTECAGLNFGPGQYFLQMSSSFNNEMYDFATGLSCLACVIKGAVREKGFSLYLWMKFLEQSCFGTCFDLGSRETK